MMSLDQLIEKLTELRGGPAGTYGARGHYRVEYAVGGGGDYSNMDLDIADVDADDERGRITLK